MKKTATMTDLETIRSCLPQIPPASCDYEQWLSVGMALKDAGGSVDDWDTWSRPDPRYRAGDCGRRWAGFKGGAGAKVGVGSIVHLCRQFGGSAPTGRGPAKPPTPFDWDDPIGGGPMLPPPVRSHRPESQNEPLRIVSEWLADLPLPPVEASPIAQFTTYLETLFGTEDHVCIVTEAYKTPPDAAGQVSYQPKRGVYDRTAGELIEALAETDDLAAVIGDWNPAVGAWIRFNPLDGNGVSDSNVSAFRYALVESDNLPVERQHAIIRELQLPVAALVYSGGKSIHAIVRIDAPDYKEYQKRVDFLYDACAKNGLEIDRKNRNPSRLSRLPGASRNGKQQSLLAVNIGQPSWPAWFEWIGAQNDDLPEFENLADSFHNLPPLAPVLIDGILRRGHKMRLQGPPKAGKSLLLQCLAISIAEGLPWLKWNCVQGRVLYINGEVDHRSFKHRLHDIYVALGIPPRNVGNIDMWNLKGYSIPMDALAPKLIRRALRLRNEGKGYDVVIVDPQYKVAMGDENSAADMARFVAQYDKVCNELGTAVVDCHHHSKGEQGQKRAGDRGSGSGVFHRDPDALLDLIQLQMDEAQQKTLFNRHACATLGAMLDEQPETALSWRDDCPQDDQIVAGRLLDWSVARLGPERPGRVWAEAKEADITAWRVEGSLREFRHFRPANLIYDYPRFMVDTDGLLTGSLADGERRPRKKEAPNPEKTMANNRLLLESNYNMMAEEGPVHIQTLAEALNVGDRTVRNWLKDFAASDPDFKLRTEGGYIVNTPPPPATKSGRKARGK